MVNYHLFEVSKTAPLVIFTHGIGEYGLLYEGFSKQLNQAGYSVILYDVRGHGDHGKKGYLKDYKLLISDLDEILHKERNNRQVFLIGHSLGAMISHLYAVSRDHIEGVVSIGYNYHLMKIVAWLGRLLPNRKLRLNWRDTRSRHQKSEAEVNDPNLLKFVTYKMLYETIHKANKVVHKNLSTYKPKLLIIHGGADKIVSIDNAHALYDHVNTKKDIIIYPNSYHDVLLDIDQDIVIKDITNWLNEQK